MYLNNVQINLFIEPKWPIRDFIEVNGYTVRFTINKDFSHNIYLVMAYKANQTFYNKASKLVKQEVESFKNNYMQTQKQFGI